MGHPVIDNPTPFAFEAVHLADEDGAPLAVLVSKATYDIGPSGLTLSLEQDPVNLTGEAWGDPATSSWRFEPEGTLRKVATDVVLLGSAVAPRPGTREMSVTFQVGPVGVSARVVGDRVFFNSVGGIGLTEPVPFERIPLRWERAFGGWDRSDRQERNHDREARNPVGTGFRTRGAKFQEGVHAPNVEDPRHPLRGWGERPDPVGFGFTSPHWEPRARHAGTYDEKWQKERAPLLPRDFDRRFLNAAPPGLIAPGYLRGDEMVAITGTHPRGPVSFRLPAVAPPAADVSCSGREDKRVPLVLDTMIVDMDEAKLLLLWRGELGVSEPTAVRAIRVIPGAGTPAKRSIAA